MRFCLLVILFLFSHAAGAQKPFTRDLTLTESKAGVRVNALAQDAHGYLWIGTDIGLIQYNGQNFTIIGDSIRKPVTAIFVSGQAIWVGYSNGKIGTVVNQFVDPVFIKNAPSSAITSLRTNGLNVLLATTEEEGLFVIYNNQGVQINVSDGLSDDCIYDVSIINQAHIVAVSDIGINDISVVNGKVDVTIYNTKQGLPDNIVTVIKKIPGKDIYWVGMQEGGVALYDRSHGKIAELLPRSGKWIYGQVNDILPVSDKRAWVATESGYLVEMIRGEKTELRAHHYPGKSFKKLLADRSGNIWCGTGTGLTMMTGEYVSDIRLQNPYSLYEVSAMVWADTTLLIALKKDLYRVSINDTGRNLVKVFTAKAAITSLYNDKNGRLWIGTLGDGLYAENNKSVIERLTGISDTGNDANILNISGTNSGVWLAGLKGVQEFTYPINGKVGLVKYHGKKTGIGSDYVYQLCPDKKGNIWMATDGAGVCMYDGSQYHHWGSSFGQNGKVAYSITEDASGDIWAATMYKDLYRFHDNKWTNLRLPETQYPDINISTVVANASGQVISVYQRCVDEWYPKSGYFRHFNSAMGIGMDSTSNVLNCVAKDNDGNIYLPYQHGIAMFRNQTGQFDISPGVRIIHPTVYSKPVLNGKWKFGHDENYIGFTFDGISFANHERLNYRYKLEGYNDDWIYTNDASVSFPRLSPGEYKFRIQVSLNPAFAHPNEDSYYFTIAAPFWSTGLFYFSVAAFILVMGYLYIKLREKRLKSISQLQQERMMFEYEHLKSQVNPHFLFNSLYALSILIEEKRENALNYTVHLADLYRNMLAHGKNDLIPLREEFDILESYIHIQQTRFGEALHMEIDIPEEVMETKKIVPLAIQLLVENAIKHNVVSMAHPLVIFITVANDEIMIRNLIQPKISKEKGQGIGLINIKQRYGLLTKRPVTFGVFDNQYIVKLPLL